MCFVGLLVFFLFPFFLALFFFKTDPATDQQTNKPTLGPNSLRSIAGQPVSMLVASANKPPSDQHSAVITFLQPLQSPTRCHPQPPGPTVAWLVSQHPLASSGLISWPSTPMAEMDRTALQSHLTALAQAHPGEHPFTLALRLQVATGREITGAQAAKWLQAGGRG